MQRAVAYSRLQTDIGERERQEKLGQGMSTMHMPGALQCRSACKRRTADTTWNWSAQRRGVPHLPPGQVSACDTRYRGRFEDGARIPQDSDEGRGLLRQKCQKLSLKDSPRPLPIASTFVAGRGRWKRSTCRALTKTIYVIAMVGDTPMRHGAKPREICMTEHAGAVSTRRKQPTAASTVLSAASCASGMGDWIL
ncbi:unnamed protein product [Ectocarpus fasciculatus]